MSTTEDIDDSIAMDDSFDVDSFRTSSMGGAWCNLRTHGSYISSSSPRSSFRESDPHVTINGSNPGSSSLTTKFPVVSDDESESFHMHPAQAPRVASEYPAGWRGRASRSDAASGVLIGKSEFSAYGRQQDHPLQTSKDSAANWARTRHPVALEGSPLPRETRDGYSNESRKRVFSGGPDIGGGWSKQYPPSTEKGGSFEQACRAMPSWRSHSVNLKEQNRHYEYNKGSQRCVRVSVSAAESDATTSPTQPRGWSNPSSLGIPQLREEVGHNSKTPRQDEDGSMEGEAQEDWGLFIPSRSIGGGHASVNAKPGPKVQETPECEGTALYQSASRTKTPTLTEQLAPGLSTIGERDSIRRDAGGARNETRRSSRDIRSRPNQQDEIFRQGKEKAAVPEDDLHTVRKANYDAEKRGFEQRVSRKLAQLEEKTNRLEAAGIHSSSGLNNVASIISGTHEGGQGINRTELDIRDLSKQVLKMNTYEKVKREQSLLDRLASIEEKLSSKAATVGPSTQQPAVPSDHARLQGRLTAHEYEIRAIKKEIECIRGVYDNIALLHDEVAEIRERSARLDDDMAYQYPDPARGLGKSTGIWDDKPIDESFTSHTRPSRQSFGFGGAASGRHWSDDWAESGSWGHSRTAPSLGGWSDFGDESGCTRSSCTTHRAVSFDVRPLADYGSRWTRRSQDDNDPVLDTSTRIRNSYGWGRDLFQASFDRLNRDESNEDFTPFRHGSTQIGTTPPPHRRSRCPTVETIVDETDVDHDEFKTRPSRTHTDGSWDRFGPRPSNLSGSGRGRSGKYPSFEGHGAISQNSGVWANFNQQPSPPSRGREPECRHVQTPTPLYSDFGGHATYGTASGTTKAEKKQRELTSYESPIPGPAVSRDHWRCPRTASKWEGETGRGLGSGREGGCR